MLVARDYQDAAINATFEYFKTNPGNPIIGLPTGTGKAFVIAEFIRRALAMYSRQKILVVTHVKELIDQNFKEFKGLWPTAPAGIFSAGLGKRDSTSNVIFCGIASIAKNPAAFGRVDLFVVDECHLISSKDESNYMKVIVALKTANPYMKVIGLTATPWRQGVGCLTNGGIFTDFSFNMTDMRSFNWFLQEGYLVPLVSKPTETILDVSGVKLTAGEYNLKQLDFAVNQDKITLSALEETLHLATIEERRSWLVFATSIEHAENIVTMLESMGVSAKIVHSKMKASDRDKNIQEWKELKFTAIVNMGVLTTGVNHPALDLIVMLRPTQSTVLWVQMLGRGTRPLFAKGFDLTTREGRLASIAASPKQNCRVLDYSQNIKRLGPINDPVVPRKKGDKIGEAPVKICDGCGMYNHISARYCGGQPFATAEGCGTKFNFMTQLKQQASSDEILKNDAPIVEVMKVDRVTCARHRKQGKADSLKVSYYCGLRKIDVYVMPEHPGFGRRKALQWWSQRSTTPLPETTDEALEDFANLPVPTHVRVWINRPWPEILAETFDGTFKDVI